MKKYNKNCFLNVGRHWSIEIPRDEITGRVEAYTTFNVLPTHFSIKMGIPEVKAVADNDRCSSIS